MQVPPGYAYAVHLWVRGRNQKFISQGTGVFLSSLQMQVFVGAQSAVSFPQWKIDICSHQTRSLCSKCTNNAEVLFLLNEM